jgi:hypothetical protein
MKNPLKVTVEDFDKHNIDNRQEKVRIEKSGNINNELNNWHIQNVFSQQNDPVTYQDLVSKLSWLLDDFYKIVEDMKHFNNNNT